MGGPSLTCESLSLKLHRVNPISARALACCASVRAYAHVHVRSMRQMWWVSSELLPKSGPRAFVVDDFLST